MFAGIYHFKLAAVTERLRSISNNYPILIMGDSVMQRISPAFFHLKTYNLAGSAEHYYFTYSKLKRILSFAHGKVKHVVLGISVHNFAPVYQKLFSLNYSEGQRSLKRYLYFMDFQENRFVDLKSVVFEKSLFKAITRDPYWGGFKESGHKNPGTGTIQRILQMHYSSSGLGDAVNTSAQEYYIDRIVSLCRDRGVHLLLVSTPALKEYQLRTDTVYLQSLMRVVNKYDGLKYLNFLDVDITGDYMSDANHLNRAGAAIYSALIAREVARDDPGG